MRGGKTFYSKFMENSFAYINQYLKYNIQQKFLAIKV